MDDGAVGSRTTTPGRPPVATVAAARRPMAASRSAAGGAAAGPSRPRSPQGPRLAPPTVTKRMVSQASPSPDGSPGQPGDRDDRLLARGERRQRAGRTAWTTSPSTASVPGRAEPGQVPDVLAGSGSRRGRRRRSSGVAVTADGCGQGVVLPEAGFGVRSGQTSPSRQKLPSCGDLAEVAAVGPARRPVGQPLDEAVVPPLPDEAALEPGRRLDRVPVVRERPVGVAHRVRVLAHDQRVALGAGAGVLDDRLDRRVHRTGQVRRRPGRSSSPTGSHPRSGAGAVGS